jgi:hypothetical protein
MRYLIIGMLTVLISATAAFAQQQPREKPASAQANKPNCPKGYNGCIRGGTLKMGYTQVEAAAFCTRACR